MCKPMATPETPGAFRFGLRLMAIDGTTQYIPDTPRNVKAFRRPKASSGQSAFPQLRIVCLMEVGTHAICDVTIRSYRTGEAPAGRRLLRSVEPGMLVLWDRGFHSFAMVQQTLARGAHFLGRVPKNVVLKPLKRFGDGSFLAEMYASKRDRKHRRDGVRVRVLE